MRSVLKSEADTDLRIAVNTIRIVQSPKCDYVECFPSAHRLAYSGTMLANLMTAAQRFWSVAINLVKSAAVLVSA